jgi:hypothetical protein
LTAYRTVATTGKAKATATKAKPSGRAATTTKKATTKKAALKKPAAKTKKTAVRKAASKKKAAPKKKKAAPKKKVAAKPKKKVLTDEQKEAKKAKAKLLKFRSTKQEMLKQALAPPTKKPDINFSGYSLFLSQSMSGHNLKDSKDTFTSEIAKKWSALPEAEKQARLPTLPQEYCCFWLHLTPKNRDIVNLPKSRRMRVEMLTVHSSSLISPTIL